MLEFPVNMFAHFGLLVRDKLICILSQTNKQNMLKGILNSIIIVMHKLLSFGTEFFMSVSSYEVYHISG
jgi:hypothetical protein